MMGMMNPKTRLRQLYTTFTLSEISGSLGDLGTLLPLLVALSQQRSIAIAPVLFFGGIANIITGWFWDVPMCVQPMKSIAAVALSSSYNNNNNMNEIENDNYYGDNYQWTIGTMTAAGLWTGLFIFLLGITNGIELVNAIVPSPVVSGLQVGVGLRLAQKGLNMVKDLGWVNGLDCALVAVLLGLCCLYWLREAGTPSLVSLLFNKNDNSNENGRNRWKDRKYTQQLPSSSSSSSSSSQDIEDSPEPIMNNTDNSSNHQINDSSLPNHQIHETKEPNKESYIQHPVGIYLFLIGVLFATITLSTVAYQNNSQQDDEEQQQQQEPQYDLPLRFFGAPVVIMAIRQITRDDIRIGLLEGAIPQLPLTTLNSVISVCALAHSLYPEKRKKRQRSCRADVDCADDGDSGGYDNEINETDRNNGKDNDEEENNIATPVPIADTNSTTTTTTNTTSKSNDQVISRKEVAISVGLMNILLCPFGSMPNCHGAGGLAGQHRFGARYGTSVLFLGLVKMALGIFLGGSALTLLDAFPDAVLGIMLVIAGLELATTGFILLVKDCSTLKEEKNYDEDGEGKEKGKQLQLQLRQGVVVAVITTMVIVTLGKTHYGALSGWVAYMIYGDGISNFISWRKRRRRGRM